MEEFVFVLRTNSPSSILIGEKSGYVFRTQNRAVYESLHKVLAERDGLEVKVSAPCQLGWDLTTTIVSVCRPSDTEGHLPADEGSLSNLMFQWQKDREVYQRQPAEADNPNLNDGWHSALVLLVGTTLLHELARHNTSSGTSEEIRYVVEQVRALREFADSIPSTCFSTSLEHLHRVWPNLWMDQRLEWIENAVSAQAHANLTLTCQELMDDMKEMFAAGAAGNTSEARWKYVPLPAIMAARQKFQNQQLLGAR
jgi:hypothetical protein